MTVRAKFKVILKDKSDDGYKITMEPVISGSKENEDFFKWTPWGRLDFGTINESAASEFELDKEYYLDFSLAE